MPMLSWSVGYFALCTSNYVCSNYVNLELAQTSTCIFVAKTPLQLSINEDKSKIPWLSV